ncbi:MAG TPA: drug/metabolite exporter YedA [Ktedonobacterales bacterium]
MSTSEISNMPPAPSASNPTLAGADEPIHESAAATSATTATEQPTTAAPATPGAGASSWLGIMLAMLAIYIIWGSTYFAIRLAIDGFPPFLMAGIRFLLAGGLMYGFLRWRGQPNPSRKEWAGAGLVGTLLLVGGNGLVSFAEQSVASGLASLIVASVPLWAVIFSGFWKQWPHRLEWVGLGIGFVGVAFLNLGGSFSGTPLGALILLLAASCWAMGSVVSTHVRLPKGQMASAAEMLVGGVILLTMGLVQGQHISGPLVPHAVWALLYLVVFGSLVAFSAFTYLLQRVRPTIVTSYAYVNPLVALALGALFIGEKITLTEVLAMLLILAGVALVGLAKGRKTKR